MDIISNLFAGTRVPSLTRPVPVNQTQHNFEFIGKFRSRAINNTTQATFTLFPKYTCYLIRMFDVYGSGVGGTGYLYFNTNGGDSWMLSGAGATTTTPAITSTHNISGGVSFGEFVISRELYGYSGAYQLLFYSHIITGVASSATNTNPYSSGYSTAGGSLTSNISLGFLFSTGDFINGTFYVYGFNP